MTVFDDTAALLKALADPTRLRLVRLLLEKPLCTEELAAGLGVGSPTVSHHLKKLATVGLVERSRDQYYTMVQLRPEALEVRLRDLVDQADDGLSGEERRLAAYRRKILGTFFRDGRLSKLPAQRKKRLVVLDAFAADFTFGQDYAEEEVNAMITRRFADYCAVRRELVDARMMTRTPAETRGFTYRLTAKPEGEPLAMATAHHDSTLTLSREERKERAQHYKHSVRRSGIYGVRNLESGRLLLGSALNLHGPLNRHRAELGLGTHRCKALQADWDALGPEAFSFEVFDTVDPELEGAPREAALRKLETEWLGNFQPLTERCYNSTADIRRRVY